MQSVWTDDHGIKDMDLADTNEVGKTMTKRLARTDTNDSGSAVPSSSSPSCSTAAPGTKELPWRGR